MGNDAEVGEDRVVEVNGTWNDDCDSREVVGLVCHPNLGLLQHHHHLEHRVHHGRNLVEVWSRCLLRSHDDEPTGVGSVNGRVTVVTWIENEVYEKGSGENENGNENGRMSEGDRCGSSWMKAVGRGGFSGAGGVSVSVYGLEGRRARLLEQRHRAGRRPCVKLRGVLRQHLRIRERPFRDFDQIFQRLVGQLLRFHHRNQRQSLNEHQGRFE